PLEFAIARRHLPDENQRRQRLLRRAPVEAPRRPADLPQTPRPGRHQLARRTGHPLRCDPAQTLGRQPHLDWRPCSSSPDVAVAHLLATRPKRRRLPQPTLAPKANPRKSDPVLHSHPRSGSRMTSNRSRGGNTRYSNTSRLSFARVEMSLTRERGFRTGAPPYEQLMCPRCGTLAAASGSHKQPALTAPLLSGTKRNTGGLCMSVLQERPHRTGTDRLVLLLGVGLFVLFCGLAALQLLRKNRDVVNTMRSGELQGENLLSQTAGAVDWPGWRGLQRDGVAWAPQLLTNWSAAGPKVLWETAGGEGFSSFALAQGKLVTMLQDGADEAVLCLNVDDGRELWRFRYPARYSNSFGNGPRSTPAIDGDHVYTVGGTGLMHCLKLTPATSQG